MIDLHVHTDRSDGSTPPEQLVRDAVALGIEALGIADHDTLAGYDVARGAAEASGLELVCAVELSTRPQQQKGHTKRERSTHLLGYFLVSAPEPAFRKWLESHQASRRQRNLDLIAKLRRLGIEITLMEAEVYGRNQVGRPHIAKVLLDKGFVSNMQEAFDRYLGDDAQAAVERAEPTLEEGIRKIREGGGMASLAHPVRLSQHNGELTCLVAKLADQGLQGIEAFHSEHDSDNTATYLKLAQRFDLVATGGSDFHGDHKPNVRLGTGINGNVRLPYEVLRRMRARNDVKSKA